jgi:hypothetical protein
VNQFHYNRFSPDEDARVKFRENGPIRYGLFDFDLAVIVSQTSSPCLLPVEMARVGSPWHHPSDADEGSFYDPFKFDVACMGQMLFFYNVSRFSISEPPRDMLRSGWNWQHLTPIMPLLAPLIHRMSTQDLEYRFTAAEALAFCRYIRRTYSDLNAELPSQLSVEMEVGADPWRYLPSEYARLWSPQGKGWANIKSLRLAQ